MKSYNIKRYLYHFKLYTKIQKSLQRTRSPHNRHQSNQIKSKQISPAQLADGNLDKSDWKICVSSRIINSNYLTPLSANWDRWRIEYALRFKEIQFAIVKPISMQYSRDIRLNSAHLDGILVQRLLMMLLM